jgi:integrase
LENPLAHIALLNAKADQRLERRALVLSEIGRLLAAAEAGETTHGMTGADRALLYRFALETGFRWSE